MFEREIKFIYDFNLNKINKLGPYFTFDQLATSDINPAILHYISSEIDYLIFEDRQKLLKNSVFDYSGEKISQLFEQVGDEVKRKKRFSMEYVSKLILHASSFTINFLVRPKWTLIKFVFDEGGHKTTSEIKQILNYLYYYRHIKTILISYINTKKIISMNSEEFTALLNKVDNLGVETYLPSVLSGSLKSMAEFFNIGEVQKNKIPLFAVQTFLEEKNLTKHCEKILSVFGEDGSVKFSLAEFQKVFDGIMPEKEEFIADQDDSDLFEQVVEEQDIDKPVEPENEIQTQKNTDENDKNLISSDKEPVELKKENFDEVVDDDSLDLAEDKDSENKPAKIRINIKDNNKIEKIEDGEINTQEKKNEDDSIEDGNDLFNGFDENVIKEIIEEPVILQNEIVDIEDKSEEVENGNEEVIDEFDKVDEVIDSMVEKRNRFIEDSENEEEISDPDETSKNILNSLVENLDTDNEKENILESMLHGSSEEEDFDEKENIRSRSIKNQDNDKSKKMDLAELLEHKDMTKIIEVVFDYDIEEFSSTLEEIMDCENIDSATGIVNQSLKQHGINRKSKEAELFKQIISDFFSDKN